MIWLPINALFSCACVQWVGLVFIGRCTDLLLKRHTAKRFRSSGCASISNKEMQGWRVINAEMEGDQGMEGDQYILGN